VSALLFSLIGVIVRFFSDYFGNVTQASVRNMAALCVLAVVMLGSRQSFHIPWKSINKLAFLGFCLSGAFANLFFILSATQIKAANSVFYLYVASFVTSFVVGTTVFKEGVTRQKIAALALAFVGLLIFSFPIQVNLSTGVLFGLLAGVADTTRFTTQKFLKGVNRRALLFYSFAVAAIILMVLAALSGEQTIRQMDTTLLLMIPALGVVFVLLAEALTFGFDNFPLNMGTIVVSGELLFAMIVNALLLHEWPSITEMIGAVMIFGAILLVNTTLPGRLVHPTATA
jgi:drug/metabolite transporter (DMT)-like permease